jgi:hypothetical protein
VLRTDSSIVRDSSGKPPSISSDIELSRIRGTVGGSSFDAGSTMGRCDRGDDGVLPRSFGMPPSFTT